MVKSCKVAPRHYMTGARSFETNGIVATSRVETSIHIGGYFDPWRLDHHYVTKRRVPITWRRGATSHRNGPQLHSCESLTIVLSCKCWLLVQFDNYYDPFYPQNPKIHQDLGLSLIDDASDLQLCSVKLFPAPSDVIQLSCSQKTHVRSNSRNWFVIIPFIMSWSYP